ncbi:bacillithiol system redox-active protein YtxJ [Pseudotenacibaculum sp. MALMAid0570]|uniref:bacillithiol system redox-active protein YtxJ n=1 Tax=Pseudotenacibaculum sp. MALMAid0570 TaxID=3143938 RepID=UPI0032DE4135
MSLLNTLFGRSEKKEELSNVNWLPLNSIDQLVSIKELSKSETVLIFKHSTRCGISRMVIKQFEKMFDESMRSIKVYYLDLLNYRDVSNEVGYTFQVLHESPQLLIIKNEVAVANASHYDITQIDISKFIE